MKRTILIVEDDYQIRTSLDKSFRRRGHELFCAGELAEARAVLRERKIDLILLDFRLPDGCGLDLLAEAHELDAEIDVIIMTAFPDVKGAVVAMKAGARDYIVKPFELEELHLSVERAIEERKLRRTVNHLERERRGTDDFHDILGASPAIEGVREQIRKVAGAETPVLVYGATGTGKELVADSVHRLSTHATGPLVKVNCSAFPEQLLESELFGHEKGAYTDAREARAGLFEMADGGSLFLDEISEMKPVLQSKLLRIVEGQPFRRVGGQREIHTGVRIIAATNCDLQERVQLGEFREDLYYRLNVVEIELPPLRNRQDDIPLLAQHFLTKFAKRASQDIREISPAAMRLLQHHGWPGNVRELENAMERAVVFCRGTTIHPEHLPFTAAKVVERESDESEGHSIALPPNLSDAHYRDAKQQVVHMFDRYYFTAVLRRTGGNVSEAARASGLDRSNFRRAARRAGVDTRLVRDSSTD